MAENTPLARPCLESCRYHGLFSFCPRGSHSPAKMPRVSRKESRPVSQRQRASLAKITCGFGKEEPAVYPQIQNTSCGEGKERLRERRFAMRGRRNFHRSHNSPAWVSKTPLTGLKIPLQWRDITVRPPYDHRKTAVRQV